jgi:hypothetical protein
MNPLTIRLLNKARSAHIRLFGLPPQAPHLTHQHSGQAASDAIRARLASGRPCLVCRFGRSEMMVITRYLDVSAPGSFARKAYLYARNRIGPFWWDDALRVEMLNQSGFFPGSDENLAAFAELMLRDMREIDILGAWLPGELRVAERLAQAESIPLGDLEPYRNPRPWSEVLEGRTVLVIHPFEETIRSQYARREEIFPGQRVLPEFELKTLRAVQSVVGTKVGFARWFDALDSMRDRVSAMEFDTAIIGAGAYGMPLAAHVKRMGKQAVHLGGATQLLFGIRGKRWDDREDFLHLFNDAWVHPSQAEVPANYRVLEQGAYW